MPMLEQRIQQHFIDSADLKYQSAQSLSKPIAAAVQAMLACVTSGGKVLACGNGGSAADCVLLPSLAGWKAAQLRRIWQGVPLVLL